MAEAFTLWDSVSFDNSVVTGNGTFDLSISPVISNNAGNNSLRVVLDYESVAPDDDAIQNTFMITAVAESQGDIGAWFIIAYQFSPYIKAFQGRSREMILQPNISTFDSGVDDSIFVGFDEIGRISRQQGKLGSSFRVRLILTENGYGQPGAFQSATISGYGERFDV